MSIMIPAWVNGSLVPVEKLEAHKRGFKHKAVSVFILQNDSVLLQQRALEKYHTPGLWANTCCTHPDWDEDPNDCAVRRLTEELGIKNLNLEHRHHLEYRAKVGGGLIEHEVVDVYVGYAPPNFQVELNPDEVMAIEWLSFTDIKSAIEQNPERFTPWLKIYMAEHANTIFGDDLVHL
jgi:isopentenyl-diphosphate delta-isomerase